MQNCSATRSHRRRRLVESQQTAGVIIRMLGCLRAHKSATAAIQFRMGARTVW